MNRCLIKCSLRARRSAHLLSIALAGVIVCITVQASAQRTADRSDSAAAALFETKIRPLLIASCVNCHCKDNQSGGLRLDAPIAPDKAKLLVARINGLGGKPRMPLGSSLPKEKVALLESWVKAGAVWPAVDAQAQANILDRGKHHWALQPISHPAPPAVKQAAWVRNPIDAFILSGLEKRGLHPSPAAPRRELIRRLYYDLIGLPPTPEAVTAFENNRSPDAYEKLVDQLLATPQYGEKWARHWLDIVRYAETNSYERDNPKPNVYKYRDYVIRAFNTDKPYNQFVREQIAGDEMGGAGDAIVATGYYRLGIWDDEPADVNQAEFDDLDDLVVTTGQAFLGLTLDCARCHDHKFDPVPQRDYYRMAAFFRGINRFKNGGPTDEATYFETPAEKAEYDKKLADIQARRAAAAAQIKQVETAYRARRDGLIHPDDFTALNYRYYEGSFNAMPDFNKLTPVKSGALNPAIIDLKTRRRDEFFGYVFDGALKVPRDGEYTFYIDTDDGSILTVNGKQLARKEGGGQGAEMSAKLALKAGSAPFRIDYFQATGPFGLNFSWSGPGFARRPLSALSACSDLGISTLMRAELAQIVGKDQAEAYNKLAADKAELDKLDVPEMKVLCVTESGTTAPDMFVLKRGNPATPDEKVQPGFPACLGGGDAIVAAPPTGGKTTGRRTLLANWLVNPTNPLPARVIVNRIWQWHFGRGIVRTPNDFGLQGARPTQPQLLDWLASEFVNRGWSIKKLSKLIVMSNAYKQSSRANTAGMAKDPENNLFWRFDMRRLDGEEIRDSLLAVSGTLNLQMYGPPIYPPVPKEILAAQSRPGADWDTAKMTPADLNRRSIYIHVKRSLLYPLLASFDLADTDRTSAVRFASTQPTQALSMLNGDFANAEAQALATRIRKEQPASDKAFVSRAFWLALQRPPTDADVKEGIALMARLRSEGAALERAQDYVCLMVLNLDEFMYVD